MQESDKRAIDSRVGKTLFLIVIFFLVLMVADRIRPGSVEIVGALAGVAIFAAFFGGILATLLDRLFLTQMLGSRTGLLASCLAMWVLVVAYLLTLRPDGIVEHHPMVRILGTSIGMCMVFWFRRRQQRAAAQR